MSTPATPTDVLQGPCPTKPIALTLPLAAIEQLDQLAESQHISRQALLGLIVKAALLRDTPWWREGEDAIDRLADQAYRHQGYGRVRAPGNPNSEGRSAPDCPSEALWRSGGSAVRPARIAERLSVVLMYFSPLSWAGPRWRPRATCRPSTKPARPPATCRVRMRRESRPVSVLP
jgi:hypothetical protein